MYLCMSAAMDAVAVSRACVSGGSGRRAAANAPAVRCTKKKFTQSVTASPLSAQLKKNARAAVAQKKKFHAKRDCVATGDSGRPKAAGPC